jgi:hypothetical protein
MLEIERLNELFGLLEAMTQSKTGYPESTSSPKIQRLQKWLIRGFLFTASMILVLAAWQHFVGTVHPGFYYAPLIVPLILLGLTAKTSVSIALDQRRQHSSIMLTALKKDLHCDAKLITQLWTFDEATLAYGLVQYRHRWSSFERHLAALARKPGLFGVVAILIYLLAALLLEEKDSDLLLWGLGIAAVILYVGVFEAFVSLERPKQIIKLLEYAIQQADQCKTTPSEAAKPQR